MDLSKLLEGTLGKGEKAPADRNGQVVRILQLLLLLGETRRGLSTAEIQAELYKGKGRRTFFRDLDAVREAGIQIERRRVKGSRAPLYILPHPPAFSRLHFTQDELFSLLFARTALRALKDTPLHAGLDSALDKIMNLLPEDLHQRCFAYESYFVTRPGRGLSYRRHAETIRILADAIARDRKVVVDYRKPGRDAADRHVLHPYLVIHTDGLLYVRGFSELRREERTFRLDRIASIAATDDAFKRPAEYRHENLHPDDVFDRSFQIMDSSDLEEIVLDFNPQAAQHVRDRTWHSSQEFSDLPDGGVRLSLRLPVNYELAQWVLSFADEVRVVKPPALARDVARRLRDASRRYSLAK